MIGVVRTGPRNRGRGLGGAAVSIMHVPDGGVRLPKESSSQVLTKETGFSMNLQKCNFATELDAEVHSINYHLD